MKITDEMVAVARAQLWDHRGRANNCSANVRRALEGAALHKPAEPEGDLDWDSRVLWRELDKRGAKYITVPIIQEALQASALRASPSTREEVVEETAWLVEWQNHGPCWWGRHNPTLEDDEFGWTTDSLRAIRFARKEDAEMYIREVGWNDVLATEHIWYGPALAPQKG